MSDKQLVKKLAQGMQQVQYIQKRGHNKFHNYKYATEADVNEKVREELSKQNVIMLPSMKSHDMRETKTKSGNTEYIVCVDMEFKFVDGDTGEELSIQMSGEGQDVGDKAIYKAISGAQKYALMKVFMIPTGDDPEADTGGDGQNPSGKVTPIKPNPDETKIKATKSAITAAIRKVNMAKEEFNEILSALDIADYTNINADQAQKILSTLATYKPKEAVN
jgi:hypothetical protein